MNQHQQAYNNVLNQQYYMQQQQKSQTVNEFIKQQQQQFDPNSSGYSVGNPIPGPLSGREDIKLDGDLYSLSGGAGEAMSPLSPLDEPHPLSANRSVAGSPYGTPGTVVPPQFYSMSVPLQGFHSNSAPQHNMQFGSYGHSQITSMSSNSIDPEDPTQRQSVEQINEKRRKRRESHNAVERRRRDHINEKIQELASLLPEFASDAQNKPNKGIILRRSVEYIRHMQLFAARQMDRTLELEQCLMRICQNRGIEEGELGLSMPLGTPIQLPALNQYSAQDMEDPQE